MGVTGSVSCFLSDLIQVTDDTGAIWTRDLAFSRNSGCRSVSGIFSAPEIALGGNAFPETEINFSFALNVGKELWRSGTRWTRDGVVVKYCVAVGCKPFFRSIAEIGNLLLEMQPVRRFLNSSLRNARGASPNSS